MSWKGKFPFFSQLETEEAGFANEFSFELADFSGPLNAFLNLLDNETTKLSELTIFPLVERYQSLVTEKKYSMRVQSGFLLLAAALLEMKSRLLLPLEKEEEEELVPDDRLRHEELYQQYRARAKDLHARKEEFENIFLRGEVLPVDAFPQGPIQLSEEVGVDQLVAAFQKLMREVGLKENPREIQTLEPTVTVAEKVELIEKSIQENIEGVPLRSLLVQFTRLEIIVTFVAILELAKRRRILVRQLQKFGEIIIAGNTSPQTA